MLDRAEYTKVFLALLVIVNPLGAVPLFVSMTGQHAVKERRRIARVASSAGAVVPILAAVVVEIFAGGITAPLPGLR